MVDVLKKYGKQCTGCGACYNSCPVDAIEMKKNPQGFYYPYINADKCIGCKKCERVCPKLHPYQGNKEEPDCYAARAKDEIRNNSSSGGVFYVLAKWALNQNGIVCGAAMQPDYGVRHICVDNRQDLEKLRLSKYVQSDMGHVYKEIGHYLQEGRLVLFTGCPCQVAAVRNYFGRHEKNLYCVDLLCHGVPSAQMWQDYVKENFDTSQIDRIAFRSKENGWRSDQLRVFWKDGSSQRIPWQESAYEEGFQRNITLRDGCEACEFSGRQRQGDLTMGDFWRVREYDPTLDDRKGTSVLLVNNAKGQQLLDQVKEAFADLTGTPLEAARYNRLKTTYRVHPQKERFKTLYPGHTFSEAVMQCRHSLYDIGLAGIYTARNYGGQLTQYALYSALTDWGYSVLMIERPLDSPKPPHPKGAYLFEKNPYPAYARSRYFANIAEMKFLNLQCKTFLTGSDQMFNNNLYNDCGKYMTLNFAMDNHRKIAYAASFGHDRIWGEEVDRAAESYFMQKFDYFSVREDSAVDLCDREFGVKATWVLDPVFLCPQQNYEKLVEIGEKGVPAEPYLFAYVLDPTTEKENILKDYADRYHLALRAVCDAKFSKQVVESGWSIDTKFRVSMEEWIAHIAKSSFFITDSFHGMCIAIIFKKQFLVVVNKLRGETRFTSLLRLLGLGDRMVYSMQELQQKLDAMREINYERVYQKLNAERERSKKWLADALETDKRIRKPLSEFDILDARCDDLCRNFDEKYDALIQRQAELEKQLAERAVPFWGSIKWLVKKAKGGFMCLRDNGVRYTVKKLGHKIKNQMG